MRWLCREGPFNGLSDLNLRPDGLVAVGLARGKALLSVSSVCHDPVWSALQRAKSALLPLQVVSRLLNQGLHCYLYQCHLSLRTPRGPIG